MEMPPTIPRRSLVVLAAMSSPPGTENVTDTGRSTTSASAAAITRRGTGLIAGSPTARPSPGLVIVPTPGPARSCGPVDPVGAHSAEAVMRAPSVQSGSSPASFTTIARAGASPGSTPNSTRRPSGGATSTTSGTVPVTRPSAAALAAADAQVPVVQPVRRPRPRPGEMELGSADLTALPSGP